MTAPAEYRRKRPQDEGAQNHLPYRILLADFLKIIYAYCDDFGHGDNSAILPIRIQAAIDTEEFTLEYNWEWTND